MIAVIIALENPVIRPDIQDTLRRIQHDAVDRQTCRQASCICCPAISIIQTAKQPLAARAGKDRLAIGRAKRQALHLFAAQP